MGISFELKNGHSSEWRILDFGKVIGYAYRRGDGVHVAYIESYEPSIQADSQHELLAKLRDKAIPEVAKSTIVNKLKGIGFKKVRFNPIMGYLFEYPKDWSAYISLEYDYSANVFKVGINETSGFELNPQEAFEHAADISMTAHLVRQLNTIIRGEV